MGKVTQTHGWAIVAADDGMVVTLSWKGRDIMALFQTKKEAQQLIKDYKSEGLGNIPLKIHKISLAEIK